MEPKQIIQDVYKRQVTEDRLPKSVLHYNGIGRRNVGLICKGDTGAGTGLYNLILEEDVKKKKRKNCLQSSLFLYTLQML